MNKELIKTVEKMKRFASDCLNGGSAEERWHCIDCISDTNDEINFANYDKSIVNDLLKDIYKSNRVYNKKVEKLYDYLKELLKKLYKEESEETVIKEYYITKYLIKKQNYDLRTLDWLEGFHKDYFEPLQESKFKDKKSAMKEFEENYKYDDFDETYVYHFELEENDTIKEEIETICSSKPCVEYICESVYANIENKLIKRSYFSDNENDDILEELINNEFSWKACDQLTEIKEELTHEICNKLTDRKYEILNYIESRIEREFKEVFEEEKYISLIDLNDFCYNNNLESIDYKQVIEECANKEKCIIAYGISYNSDFHIYIEFNFANYDKLKHSDEDVFYEESEIIIKDIYLS